MCATSPGVYEDEDGNLVGGEAWCWGREDVGELTPPSGHFPVVALGTDHACAFEMTSTLLPAENRCWGVIEEPPELALRWIDSGSGFTCGPADEDDMLVCWGTGPATDSVPAVAASQLSVGFEHACAVDADGNAWCWGSDEFGQLGPAE